MVKDSNLSSCFNYFASTDITAKTERNISFKADLQNNEFYKAEVGDRIGRRQTAVLVLAGGGVVYMCLSTLTSLHNKLYIFPLKLWADSMYQVFLAKHYENLQ